MAKSVVTAERFAKGMTFEESVKRAGSAENLAREAFGSYFPDGRARGAPRKDNSAVLRERFAQARLGDEQAAAIKWLVAQPNGRAKILVISEDWSSDCRRDVPVLARLALLLGTEGRGLSAEALAAMIKDLCGVKYHRDHVGRLMHTLGWSHQKPETRAPQRDEDRIAHWKRREWPRVKQTLRGWVPTSSSSANRASC